MRFKFLQWMGVLALSASWVMAGEDPLPKLIEQAKRETSDARAQEQIAQFAQNPAAREASGDINTDARPSDATTDYGIRKPLASPAKPAAQLYLWPMPAGAGMAATQDRKFVYTVRYQHATAGDGGAILYLAYADSDGDGTPDQLVARSPEAKVQKPSAWSEWSFVTSEHLILIGILLVDKNSPAFLATGDMQALRDRWNAPDATVYAADRVGITPAALPQDRMTIANLQISIVPE